jgi:hypothetical protein
LHKFGNAGDEAIALDHHQAHFQSQQPHIMASTQIQQPGGHATSFEPIAAQFQEKATTKHNVKTSLKYYKESSDGSPPPPTYVGKPETYERPSHPLDVTINDIRGEVDRYTLDSNGFQIYNHTSSEKDFLDDEKIKAQYYPETEQLLKDAYSSLYLSS